MLFDLPNPPWNPHEERCIPYLIRDLRREGRSVDAIAMLVKEYATAHALVVPPDIPRLLSQRPDDGPGVVLEIAPSGMSSKVTGNVSSINGINILRRYRIPQSMIGRALLKRLISEAHVEIAIREDRDPETGFVNQFTFLAPLVAWDKSGLRTGNKGTVILSDLALPRGEHVWVADELRKHS